jgi:hypothetical protein
MMRPGIHGAIALAVTALAAGVAPSQTFSLDGVWSFAVDSTGGLTAETVVDRAAWRPVKVPSGWQSQFEDLRDYQGVAWYRREVEVSPPPPNHVAVLRFDAVDYMTHVYVNRRLVATHEGGYTPFEAPCGDILTAGTHEILLRVLDPTWHGAGTEGINYKHIPHGKQSWYIQTSGPWQSIRLDIVPARRVHAARFTPEMSGSVLCEVVLTKGVARDENEEIKLEIGNSSGGRVVTSTRRVATGADTVRWSVMVNTPEVWSPESPRLYTATVRFGEAPPVVERFGFRSFEGQGGLFMLNGAPYYMIGALDQDFYPETIYSTPSREYLREQMLAAKLIGLNTLRCHIKVPDKRYLEVADEVGLLVWYEVPNWDVWTRDAARRSRETLDGMLERDWNHPSLVAVSIINESWGIDLGVAEQRTWLADEVAYARRRAPGRLVVDNSACWGNAHVVTDIADWHTYRAIPERSVEFDREIADYASRPHWLFTPHGDAVIRGDEPLVLSEFGTWGLPDISPPGPWWLERRFFDNDVVHPQDFDRRFADFDYDAVFGTYARLAGESQRAQADALKYQIESIRIESRIAGYVITEFTDVMWECNGLLDMWRRPKECRAVLPSIQQQDMIVVRPDRYNVSAGDSARFQLWFSHFGPADAAGGRVQWTWEGKAGGIQALPDCARGSVVQLTPVTVAATDAPVPVERVLEVRIIARSGVELARNSQMVVVYPAEGPPDWPRVAVHDPHGALARVAASATRPGVRIAGDDVTVTNVLDDEMVSSMRGGGTVLCLVDSTTIVPEGFPLTVVSRDSGFYDGNWASAVNWVRPRSPVIGWLPTAPRLGFAPGGAGLPFVLGGLTSDWMPDVHAGMFIGWLHASSAYIAQLNVGDGKLLLCTFPVARSAGDDSFSTRLLQELIRYAAGPSFRPRNSWNP